VPVYLPQKFKTNQQFWLNCAISLRVARPLILNVIAPSRQCYPARRRVPVLREWIVFSHDHRPRDDHRCPPVHSENESSHAVTIPETGLAADSEPQLVGVIGAANLMPNNILPGGPSNQNRITWLYSRSCTRQRGTTPQAEVNFIISKTIANMRATMLLTRCAVSAPRQPRPRKCSRIRQSPPDNK
jgi:hypothetical protein